MPKYACPLCGGELTIMHDMVTVNADGHARPAHRDCEKPGAQRSALVW